MTDVPRLSWPLSLTSTGTLTTVEQDSNADIQQCITAIVLHRVGDRVDVPEMGVPDLTHGEQPLDGAEIVDVITRHEPRASTLATSTPDLVESIVAEVVQLNVSWTPLQQPTQEG